MEVNMAGSAGIDVRRQDVASGYRNGVNELAPEGPGSLGWEEHQAALRGELSSEERHNLAGVPASFSDSAAIEVRGDISQGPIISSGVITAKVPASAVAIIYPASEQWEKCGRETGEPSDEVIASHVMQLDDGKKTIYLALALDSDQEAVALHKIASLALHDEAVRAQDAMREIRRQMQTPYIRKLPEAEGKSLIPN